MDRRVFILPAVSVLLVVALFLGPGITGFMAAELASAGKKTLNASITVSIHDDGLVPQGSEVTVYLDGRSAAMPFSEFVRKSGEECVPTEGELTEIGYTGPGYACEKTFSTNLSGFRISREVEPGEHTIMIEVAYGDYVVSSSEQTVVV